MEFIFIVGIIIAIIGVLTIVATLRQSEMRSPASPSPEVETRPAPMKTAASSTGAASPRSAGPPPPEREAESAIEAALRAVMEPSSQLVDDDDAPTIESITSLYAHANDDIAVPETSLRINVANLLATQIEQLYAEYVKLDEERTQLAETLFSRLLMDKIERSAGRLEVTSERETLDMRERFSKVSADYNRVQFRLGSLQHLNMRLHDPRVTQQMEELVLEIQRLANKGA
jgi:hypothetical protein